VSEWWKAFFDDEYLRIWVQLLGEENSAKQAAELWSMLDLSAGCRILDAPCGWGRLSHPLALLGATVLGVDQSDTVLDFAVRNRGELPPARLRYLRHDLRTPLPETGFDVACNIFTSFGYGTEEEDVAIFRTLGGAASQSEPLVERSCASHRANLCMRRRLRLPLQHAPLRG
jgi:cyclopropane fatty-acyl-phospholipid synthase-like methyltransferase